MIQLVEKYVNTLLTVVGVPLTIFLSWLLLLLPLTTFTVSVCSFYFHRLIRKLIVFLHTEDVSKSVKKFDIHNWIMQEQSVGFISGVRLTVQEVDPIYTTSPQEDRRVRKKRNSTQVIKFVQLTRWFENNISELGIRRVSCQFFFPFFPCFVFSSWDGFTKALLP
jgi:hypothetical protein